MLWTPHARVLVSGRPKGRAFLPMTRRAAVTCRPMAVAAGTKMSQKIVEKALREAPVTFRDTVEILAEVVYQAEERTLRAEELLKEALELGRCAAAQAEARRKTEVQMLWIDNIKLHGKFNARGLIEYLERRLKMTYPAYRHKQRFYLWRAAFEEDNTANQAFQCIQKSVPNMMIGKGGQVKALPDQYAAAAGAIADIYDNVSSDLHSAADQLINSDLLAKEITLSGAMLPHQHLQVMRCIGNAWDIPITVHQEKASAANVAKEGLAQPPAAE